ncbi:hypothetical protein GTW25_05850 [Aliihoeflea aestuarii]|jgi:hypothetical protein|uniref:hypothetical protein n=1 Tax=Aliihoeflea aestuarii TaxID=453840 RepID=UPI0020927647|nr:hypothetical protein [Aliihoeflea aestuarii]MCO6390549.1 hypothetical protein [Aliihoeflea aestuarii]
MRILLAAAALMAVTTSSYAACYGTGNYQRCSDNSGNSYSVQRYGNTTNLRGYNSNTGSSWSQNSQHLGNSTFTRGYDADGNSWNSTTQRIGDSSFTRGMDSDGNSFSRTCNSFGCF